ncbi:hypothetical protein [Streptomyces sp. NPDC054834]
MTVGDVAEGGDAEVHSGAAAGLFGIELGEFVLGSGEADFKSFQLAEPAFAFGFGDAVDEVVPNLHQSVARGGIGTEERAADAGVFVDAGGAVGAGADADGELAALEVAEEVLPLGCSGGPVLLGGAQGAAT